LHAAARPANIVRVDPEESISREEVTGMLIALSDINADVARIVDRLETRMAKKNYRKMSPEEKARQRENQRRLEELIELRLQRDGTTREEIRRQLGLPE
jgi:hypothetical protein